MWKALFEDGVFKVKDKHNVTICNLPHSPHLIRDKKLAEFISTAPAMAEVLLNLLPILERRLGDDYEVQDILEQIKEIIKTTNFETKSPIPPIEVGSVAERLRRYYEREQNAELV